MNSYTGLVLIILTSLLCINCQKHSVAPTYSITYDGNGNTDGTVPADNKSYASGTSVGVLGNSGTLAKAGYYFFGWNTAADGTGDNYVEGNNLSISTTNVTLYAQWMPSAATWSSSTLPNSNSWLSVAFGNNTFVAVATGTDVSAYSTDNGKTWTAGTLPVSSTWSCIAYGANTFVALTSSGISATSTDGINWTKRTIPNSGGAYASIVYQNNHFVAVGPNGNPSITSIDGITWNTGTMPTTSYWTSVAYGNNTFVAVAGTNSNAATSSDGITWTGQSATAAFGSIAFGNGTFVAVSLISSGVATSTDGINWAPQSLPSSGEWRVIFANGIFVAAKANSTSVATSPDGITWKSYTTLPSSAWRSVAYGNGNFVAISNKSNTAAYAN